MTANPVSDYTARESAYRRSAEAAARIANRIGVARLGLFILGVLVVIATAESRIGVPIGAMIVGIITASFVALVAWQSRRRDQLRLFRALERGCDAGVKRAQRHWDAIPGSDDPPHARDHAFADDLRVSGSGSTVHSITRLLPRLSRSMGRVVVNDWLLAQTPPSIDTIHVRQESVRSLVSNAEWREVLSVRASRVTATEHSLNEFLAWCRAASTESTFGRPIRWIAMVLAIVTVFSFAGALVSQVPAAVVVILVATNLVVTAATRARVARALEPVAGHDARLSGLGDALHHASTAPTDASRMAILRDQLGGNEAARAFRWFDQLASFAEVRLSPMGHAVLQALVLWDLHVVDALDRWRARHGASVRAWLTALGEIEALSAFATLAYENPKWCFPEFEADFSSTLEAQSLAHPFLASTVAVANDVRIGGSGEIFFITGSNMAGKSTLLRAIGLNVVLAQAGAPVCATGMRLTRVRLRTSIEATDALERGLSLFMAELVRVKGIVDAARAPSDCRLLYIADEMLRGTNARDRHAAVAMILRHLVHAGAVGVVATHDPDLAADPQLAPHLELHHLVEQFRIEGDASTMWFDYRLRPGLATTANAMALLETVGLGSTLAE